MNVLIILVALSFSLTSVAASVLDPNKYTVCAMTMNSTNERAIFEQQVQKQSQKFNPIVELTSFGKEDWFEKACASGIKCDQVIISGHFAAGFSGSLTGNSKQKLPLKKMEKAGCSNTCDGILDHPYEVFLFGCNTLATKAIDRRGPEKYLDVLVNDDHVPLVTASFVVESRYGRTGDDNKTRIERSFRGETKQIYGFTSVGPSGKSVESLLRDYFSRTSLEAGLNKAQAARFTGKLNYVNNDLAKSLSITDFDQCTGGSDDPKDKRICTILNDSISIDKKIDTIYGALQSDDWLKYVPTINDFFKKYPPSSMTASQRKDLEDLMHNNVIKSQVKGLVKSTKSIVVQLEWLKFARNFKYLSKVEESEAITSNINRLLTEGIGQQEAKFICDNKSIFSAGFNGPRGPASGANAIALNCLSSSAKPKREPLTRESLGLDKL
jgi:hypothetical protein